MTPAEAQVLLSMASAYDNRRPDADAAKAWAAALDGLRFDDCRAALIEHYKASTEWLMPVMLRRGVKKIRDKRVLDYGKLPEPPAHLDPDNAAAYQRWLADVTRRIGDGDLEPPMVLDYPMRNVASLGVVGQRIPNHIEGARDRIRNAKSNDHQEEA